MANLMSRSLLVLVAVVSLVTCSSDVEIKNGSYSCCDGVIKFDPNCEAQWSANNSPFAISYPESKDWRSPCKMIEGGQMVMEKCLNVSATYVCKNEQNMLTEVTVQYQSQTCSKSGVASGNEGSLVLLLTAFFFLKLMC